MGSVPEAKSLGWVDLVNSYTEPKFLCKRGNVLSALAVEETKGSGGRNYRPGEKSHP